MAYTTSAPSQPQDLDSFVDFWIARWGLENHQAGKPAPQSPQQDAIRSFCISCVRLLGPDNKLVLQCIHHALTQFGSHHQPQDECNQDEKGGTHCQNLIPDGRVPHHLPHLLAEACCSLLENKIAIHTDTSQDACCGSATITQKSVEQISTDLSWTKENIESDNDLEVGSLCFG